jgi:hypothetical protein
MEETIRGHKLASFHGYRFPSLIRRGQGRFVFWFITLKGDFKSLLSSLFQREGRETRFY